MRAGSTYRGNRKRAAKAAKLVWRSLPLAQLKLKHSKTHIIVRAVPTLKEPARD